MDFLAFKPVWDRGIGILNTVRDAATNTILAILGDEEGDVTESVEAEWVQHIGFASRPSKPEPNKGGPQAVILRASDRDCVIGSRDVRCHGLYASLDYGETCMYAPGETGNSQGRVFLKKDGSIHLYTRAGNSGSGDGMTVSLDPNANRLVAINGKGFGIIADEDGVTITAGKAALTLRASGDIALIGSGTTLVDGSGIMLGNAALLTAVRGPTGVSAGPSVKVKIE